MKKVVVIGTGGHAKVVIDILNQMEGVEIIGVTSKDLEEGSNFCGYKVLGDDIVLKPLLEKGVFEELVMGIGGFRNNDLRTKVFLEFKAQGYRFFNAIHPQSYISESSLLGEGCVVFAGVLVNTEVSIGNNTILATGAIIDHETQIGNNVLVSAGVVIGANVLIGDNSLIALGAKVISAVRIGNHTLVAAGAVVVGNILDRITVFGIPAKPKIDG